MKQWARLPRIGIGLVLAAFAADGCNDGPTPLIGGGRITPEGGTILSEDGVVSADFPEGALSEGTDVVFTLGDSTPVTDAAPVGEVYTLGPEVTVSLPITLTWTFGATPLPARDGSGRPLVLFGHTRTSAGIIVPHLSTKSTFNADGSLTVESQTLELGTQLLTASVYDGSEWELVGAVTVDLNGGLHAVDAPWEASVIELIPSNDFEEVEVALPLFITGPIEDLSSSDWDQEIGEDDLGYVEIAELTGGTPWSPLSMPQWNCTAVGDGTLELGFDVAVPVGPSELTTGSVQFYEPVMCRDREQKAEYTEQVETLGEARIATLDVPDTGMVNLAGYSGSFGYRVTIAPAATIRSCVLSSMTASVNYFPRYPPGYTFIDVSAGCTTVQNLDPVNTNEVLIVVSGAGSPNNVTVDVQNEPAAGL
jgi:hypothetical protein